ncbi:ABC transporter substrate-binding protein [Paracoccus sp. (in: a-proteobacteria)]|uniref:ABC transporter substrate-binding protein n=1 Tax=Paracoccus sp. TaxID=267 RepID=UPI0026E08C37|nr:ABC transporter substrate-binding protein [Paracoccus sp. (in: a-proteobacteria)]MDO5646781.1 ABC transporter substrate-binding protein [Paracoccus sp. (in: a-proteobacteria)]
MTKTNRLALWAGASLIALSGAAAANTTIDMYYPIAVGGPLTQVIDGYVAQFMEQNPDITVNAIYSGSYIDTTTKALTTAKGGNPPALAVLLATDIFTLLDEDVIAPIDSFVTTAEDQAWLDGFMPAYMASATVDDHVWGIPFQRSTAVMYWNKDAFAEVGLDPETPPTTWDELRDYAEKLTTGDGSRYGIGIPGNNGSNQWMFGAMTAQNDVRLMNNDGTETYLTDPRVVETLQYWVDLERAGIHPPGILEWGTTAQSFMDGQLAMIWSTTGNLTNLRNNATINFGLAPMPGNPNPASVLGGGNLYIFSDAPEDQQKAAFELIKFMTSDEILADWGIQTGYVAPRDGSWDTPELQAYVAEVPAAEVARKQIPVSVPEWSTYENGRTTRVLNDAVAAALTGQKTAEQALTDAQAELDRILRPYR